MDDLLFGLMVFGLVAFIVIAVDAPRPQPPDRRDEG